MVTSLEEIMTLETVEDMEYRLELEDWMAEEKIARVKNGGHIEAEFKSLLLRDVGGTVCFRWVHCTAYLDNRILL